MTDRCPLYTRRSVLLAGIAAAAEIGAASGWAGAAPDAAKRAPVPTDAYALRTVEGWTVRVNRELLTTRGELGTRALRLLEVKLYDIARVVPERACLHLRKVPIWLGVDDGHAPCAEYHPSREWLAENGYNPEKARAVEIGNAARFWEWSKQQPSMVLHELAHAYHHQVLTYEHAGIEKAYRQAVAGGAYESVLRTNGSTERAYALTNPQEYFAEATEAFFGANDFYPFVAAELKRHDPGIVAVLEEVWKK